MSSSSNKRAPATTKFPDKEYDVSMNFLCWVCLSTVGLTFGIVPFSTKLFLGADEVTKTDRNLCGTTESKGPYGELGEVKRSTCCCCIGFSSSFGEVSPGCGCDTELVDEIVTELKARQAGRGDAAQLKRAEETLIQLDTVNAKLDLIMKHLNLDPSSVVVPSSSETMERS